LAYLEYDISKCWHRFTYIWETENVGIHRLISDNYINYSTCFLYQYFPIYRFQSVDSDLLSLIYTNCQKLGDEYHYVLEYSSLNDKRKQLLPKYFMKRHNVVKFCELLSTKKQSLLRKLCWFYFYIMTLRNSLESNTLHWFI
jgi:hypothetical protein